MGAVTRILSKTEGVTSFDVQLEAKKVVVQGTASPELLIEKVSAPLRVACCGKRFTFSLSSSELPSLAPLAAVRALTRQRRFARRARQRRSGQNSGPERETEMLCV